MKKNVIRLLISILTLSLSSCVIVAHDNKDYRHHDNGKHKGWYKHKGHPKSGTTVIILNEENHHNKGSKSSKKGNGSNGNGNGHGNGKGNKKK